MKTKKLALSAALACLCSVPAVVNAAALYNSWTTNEGESGNYILTVTDQGSGSFNFNLTVDPWNAEALGVFVDLGNYNFGAAPPSVTSSSSSPTSLNPAVLLHGTDTNSDTCGNGCNLNGLSPPVATPDGEWEMVFRLGGQGYDGVQTFEWAVAGLTDIAESDFGLVGIRAQQLCDAGDILPGDSCGGSDKSYGSVQVVPIPAAAWLFGSGLVGLAGIARRKKAK
jgi:hypothetical protein